MILLALDPIARWIDHRREQHLRELSEFLAIPSVSAHSSHAPDLQRCAEWAAAALGRAGLERVRLHRTPGNPIVYGEWLHAPGAPTILCYGHYDVQPADPLDQWESPPFQPTVRDGRLYARGATDDKGQLYIHVKAVEAYLTQCGRLPVNLKMIIEGEEEVGGHLETFVRDRPELLACDVVVNSDSAMFAPDVPSLCCALRGIAGFQVDLRGTSTDLHSGSFGGAVANPALVLAAILARLRDPDGRVDIPGFYDDVRPLTPAERAELGRLPFDEERYRRELGAPLLFGESGYTVLERVWGRPTVEVNGLVSGFTGEGLKTVIPATASAKLSMRLVPDQDPDRIGDLLESYLAAITPPTVSLTVTRTAGGRPWRASPDDPFLQAGARAMAAGFGKRPLFTREGGSNPIVPLFQEVLGTSTVMFGIGLPGDNAHAPNEHLDLGNFRKGILAAAHLYQEIASG